MKRAGLLLLALAASAAAHDFWIRPERFTPPADAPLSVRLFAGERGVGDAIVRDETRQLRFELLDAAGAHPVVGRDGRDPAGAVRVRRTGAQWLVFANQPSRVELEGAKFEAYLQAQGLDAIRERRAARGESSHSARETFSRCAKSLLHVGDTDAASAALVLAPVGLRLELVPLVDPATLAPGADGADFAVRLLFENAPLPGALLKATLLPPPPPVGAAPAAAAATPAVLPFSAPAATDITARSDADGRALLHLPRGGPWLVCAEHMLVAPADAAADHDYESLWASLSFEVPAH